MTEGILNEKQVGDAMNVLREKLGKVLPFAAKAFNEHQPLGVSPKVGVAASAIGSTAAAGVQKVITWERTAGFFFKSVVKSFKDTRKTFNELDSAYETMLRNMKAEQPRTEQPK